MNNEAIPFTCTRLGNDDGFSNQNRNRLAAGVTAQ
jgi:hypothetical protein